MDFDEQPPIIHVQPFEETKVQAPKDLPPTPKTETSPFLLPSGPLASDNPFAEPDLDEDNPYATAFTEDKSAKTAAAGTSRAGAPAAPTRSIKSVLQSPIVSSVFSLATRSSA